MQSQVLNALSSCAGSNDPGALAFLDTFKLSNDGWKVCLNLANENEYLMVLEEVLRRQESEMDSVHYTLMQKSIWDWLLHHLQLYLLIVLLFKNEYPARWSTFFYDLFNLISLDSATQENNLEAFLNICVVIDEEVIGHYITKSPAEQALNNAIKDEMRINVVERLVDTWQSVFLTFHASNSKLALLCLKLIGLYVVWIDINLVVKMSFMNPLYESLLSPTLRIQASETIGFILAKGMKPTDKLDFIETLGFIQMLHFVKESDDPDFEEAMAKLVNQLGVQVCECFEDAAANDRDRIRALEILDKVAPSLLRYLANEYDDTSSAIMCYVTQYLSVLKSLAKKHSAVAGGEKDLAGKLTAILEVLAMKMKYDPDTDYKSAQDAGEEEAMFIEMRKALKIPFDAIAAIDFELFTRCISQFVCQIFQSLRNNPSSVKWVDIELALHITYIFNEGRPTLYFVEGDPSTPTTISIVLSQMMDSGALAYNHNSIPIIYFEVLNRYAVFFETNKTYLTIALQSFLDARGLFHPIKSIRLRINYLFLRFVKTLTNFLKDYVEGVLQVLQDLVVVRPRTITSPEELSKTGEFDSQLFLFEAVGYLISLKDIPTERREGLLTIVMMPALRRIEEIMQLSQNQQIDLQAIAELGDLISSVGCITKGFPDFEKASTPAFWSVPFKTTLQGILIVLQKFHVYPSIRDSVRSAFMRMAGCMGPEILDYIPSLLSSGLLSSETAQELIDFIPFIALTIHKFKTECKQILITVWGPLRTKINFFLSQPPVGTDDVIALVNLRKADLNLIAVLFNSQLDDVLTCPSNLPDLNNTLMSIMASFDEYSDAAVLRIAISTLGKAVYCWGGSASVKISQIEIGTSQKGSKLPKDHLRRTPLAGFDVFIFERIVSVAFLTPMRPNLVLSDGQSLLILGEITTLHKVIFSVLGAQYVDYLNQIYFPSINISQTLGTEFSSALAVDNKAFRKFLTSFSTKLRSIV